MWDWNVWYVVAEMKGKTYGGTLVCVAWYWSIDRGAKVEIVVAGMKVQEIEYSKNFEREWNLFRCVYFVG